MKRKIVCILLVLLLLTMAGCSPIDPWESAQTAAGVLNETLEDPLLRENTEQMLDALIADDYQLAWDAVYEQIQAIEFRRMYVELQPVLAGIKAYELVPYNINKSYTNGVSTVSTHYMLTAGNRRFFVEATRAEGHEGLVAFYLNAYEPVEITGNLGNMKNAGLLQWILLTIGLLEWVFTICVFVDCCRHKLRKKWLWLLVIALGHLQFQMTFLQGQFRTGINAGALLGYSQLIRYSNGGFVLLLVVPAGAIAYLIIRRKLFARYEAYMQQKTAQEESAATALDTLKLPDTEE